MTSKTATKGLGAQLNLGFHVTENIILGTEATYYYTKSKQKQNIIVTETLTPTFGDPTVNTLNTNLDTDVSKFTFTVPVAIFLIVKF